jgi:hypothetical protein
VWHIDFGVFLGCVGGEAVGVRGLRAVVRPFNGRAKVRIQEGGRHGSAVDQVSRWAVVDAQSKRRGDVPIARKRREELGDAGATHPA